MKRIILLIFLFACIYINVSAQKQHNIWYFGYYAGIDFNSGSPVALTNSDMSTDEGTSSICGSAGNLLFYSEGVLAYDRSQNYMANSVILDGNESTCQSALIVPLPGSDTLFYLFTQDNNVGANGFRYSIVDMTLNGGLGDVTTKNYPVTSPSCEKLCGIRHANGTDAWIIVHDYGSNSFRAYLLQSSGLSASPVISNVGSNYVSYDYDGQIKGNVDGTKLAAALSGSNAYELYDFDNATGIISNPIKLKSGTFINPYGVEFSPNGKYLYGSTEPLRNLYQWDISSGDSAAINASTTLIALDSVESFGSLQLAPDNKIYLAHVGSSYLGVINNPDVAGSGCAFVDTGFYLAGELSAFGLPNYIKDNVQSAGPPVASFSTTDSAICPGTCINFINASANATSYQWSFPGAVPSSSTASNPQNICYTGAGSHDVALIANNSGGSDTLTFTNYITIKDAPPTPAITQLHDTLYSSTDSSYNAYQWYNDTTLIPNATDTFLVISSGGNYNIQVTSGNGCSTATGINIILGTKEFTVYSLQFTVSPNPVRNQLMIDDSQFTIINCAIYNVLGERMLSNPLSFGEGRSEAIIDVSFLSSGIYFVRLQTENGNEVRKFIKE